MTFNEDERVQRLFDDDRLMRQLGAKLVSSGDGGAVVSLRVTKLHLQSHGTCHGGVIFALADAAFAVAANSGDEAAVAQQCSINYLRAGQPGDTLIASVERRSKVGRSGIYDATVREQNGNVVAEFRGVSLSIKSRV